MHINIKMVKLTKIIIKSHKFRELHYNCALFHVATRLENSAGHFSPFQEWQNFQVGLLETIFDMVLPGILILQMKCVEQEK